MGCLDRNFIELNWQNPAAANGGSFAKLRYLWLVRLVAAADKDENFYLNYKEASGTKRRSQISAGG